jgi:hypothetical protein
MNESRYKLKGATQRNGTTATSWQTKLVVARKATEANAGKAIHAARVVGRRGDLAASSDTGSRTIVSGC